MGLGGVFSGSGEGDVEGYRDLGGLIGGSEGV